MNDDNELTPTKENLTEKLERRGARSLTSVELINLVAGFTNGKRLDDEVAMRVCEALDYSSTSLDFSGFQKIPGFGKAKASRLVAAMELTRRYFNDGGIKISGPEDVRSICHDLCEAMQEHFVVLDLDGGGCLIEKRVVFIGSLNQTLVHPREVVHGALLNRAAGMVLVHNHPSGASQPSREDEQITKRLVTVGKLIGIDVVDHVIVTRNGQFSFKAEGMLND